MKSVRVLVVLCLLVSMAGLVGCQSITDKVAEETSEKLIEGATGVDVEADDDEVTITSEDGSSMTVSESGELPDGWPEDVPVYEGNITSGMVSEGNRTVSVESEDSALDVYEWSLEQIKAEGWTVTTEFKAENGGTLAAEKGGNIVQYTVSDEDPGSVFIVFTGPK